MGLKNKILRCWNAASTVSDITGENRYFLFCEVIWSWYRWGASDEDYLTMEFYRKNSREKRRWLTSKKNNHYLTAHVYSSEAKEIFDNKEKFDQVFKKFMRHEILVCDCSEDKIRAFIKKNGQVIVKPTGGACGIGVYKCHDNPAEIDSLLGRIKRGDKLIIEQVIVQHPDMALLNPYSVNTIRMITMVDKTGKVHIINTLVKFGTNDKCISNTFGGGVCCHVDSKSGIIDSWGHTLKGERLLRHPVSGIVIPGYQIPAWDGVCEYAKQLAEVMPDGRYIGWDIVILEDGYDVIEGNIHPGQDFQACDGIGRWKEIKDLI